MRLSQLGRHAFDVLTILVLGCVYLVALAVGTTLTMGQHKVVSALATDGTVQRRGEESANRSH